MGSAHLLAHLMWEGFSIGILQVLESKTRVQSNILKKP